MFLTTERLVLRDYVEADWPVVLDYQRKPAYLRYYEWEDRSADDVRDFVKMFLDQQQANPRIKFQLAITLKSTGQLIGSCGIRMKSAASHEAGIGLELDPQYWEQGYATEAARAVVKSGFADLRLHRIYSSSIADNQGASRVLEKLGLTLEGRLRENVYFKDRWWDTLMYAILDREWKELGP